MNVRRRVLYVQVLILFSLPFILSLSQIFHLNMGFTSMEGGSTNIRGESKEEPVEEQLNHILQGNAISDRVRLFDPNTNRVVTVERWGLWLDPSYINHSCSPNCHLMIVGDALFIRAVRNIAAGEELTRAYFDIFKPLSQRDILSDRFEFE
jgi:hypothetical protein